MAKKRKRFQTGHEIMRVYVPSYVPPTQPVEDPQQLGKRSGNEVAEMLLREFMKGLSKKALRSPLRHGASNKAMRTDAASPRR